jgi:predicted nucleotidyltransferase
MDYAAQLKDRWGEIDEIREKSIGTFLEKLKKQERDNLLRVVLFGSVARGDCRIDSDLDVFVLVKDGEHNELNIRIVDLATTIDIREGECKTHLSPFIVTQKEYLRGMRISEPIFSFIEEEGVTLYDAQ